MTHKYTYTFKPTPAAFLYIFFGVIINVLGGSIFSALHAPVFLNSIGTIFCSSLLGPIGGCITGILGTIILHLDTPVFALYAISSIPVSIGIGMFYKQIKPRDTFRLVCAGLYTMFASTVVAIPLNFFLRDGYIGNHWVDALVEMLLQSGNQPIYSNVLGQLFIEFPDKMISVFLGYFLASLFYNAGKNKKGGTSY